MFVMASGRRLEYAWHGPPPSEAPTLVFLHEGLGSVSMWRGFPARVAAAAGCGALVYSRAGYGRSESITLPRPKTYLHDEALALGDVLDGTGVERAVLVGHSDGASIAIIHAGSNASDRLRALVLMAPHVHARDVNYESIAQARDTLTDPEKRRKLERHHGANAEIAFRGWNDAWLDPAFRDWSIEEYLPNVRVPMLLIQGALDEYATLDQLDTIERECSCPVERVVLDTAGHRPFKDDPDRMVDEIAVFVRRVFVSS
jgi:pimeloyl-ACP methyl ester carboxylesterase